MKSNIYIQTLVSALVIAGFLAVTQIIALPAQAGSSSACRADITGDGIVDIDDYAALVNNFLKVPLPNPRADIAGNDGFVDITDYAFLVANYFMTCSSSSSSSSSTATSTTTSSAPTNLTLVDQTLKVAPQFATGALATPRTMKLPAGFEISVYSVGYAKPRFFDFDNSGNMYLSDQSAGKVYVVRDTNSDGIADVATVIASGLDTPHGMDFHNGDLYVAEENQVSVYKGITAAGTFTEKKVLVTGIPSGGHTTRTVVIGPDNKMYVSIGSSCNLCEESDPRRAAVVRYNLDGSGQEIFSSGLRNSVGIQFAPTGTNGAMQLWSVDNGRDSIGDDIPPEEVNILTQGANYGWPYCYGNGIVNPEYPSRAAYCMQTTFPKYNMQAHSAPLGLTFPPSMFGRSTSFPMDLKQYLFIAFHGSWNRTVPTGYKIVALNTANPSAATQDFITGWRTTGSAWGRPAGIGFGTDGNMYITDDQAGVIYRVTYKGN